MGKKNEFVDLYQVLRIWPTATDEAIKKAYFNLAKLFHPDVASKADEGTNGDADGSVDFKLINEAYAVLSDPVKRREYDESLKKYGTRDRRSTAKEADKRSAQLAFEQARTAMKHNRYDKAVVLLKSAIKYDGSNAAYHSWYGFALGALNTRLHEARDACKKALEMEFYNADYHANLGYVYHQAGLKSTADEHFRESIKWDPDHALALKYLSGNDKTRNGGFMKGLLSLIGLNPGGTGAKTPH
jgi:curved DNA-binding protein CbpA